MKGLYSKKWQFLIHFPPIPDGHSSVCFQLLKKTSFNINPLCRLLCAYIIAVCHSLSKTFKKRKEIIQFYHFFFACFLKPI